MSWKQDHEGLLRSPNQVILPSRAAISMAEMRGRTRKKCNIPKRSLTTVVALGPRNRPSEMSTLTHVAFQASSTFLLGAGCTPRAAIALSSASVMWREGERASGEAILKIITSSVARAHVSPRSMGISQSSDKFLSSVSPARRQQLRSTVCAM